MLGNLPFEVLDYAFVVLLDSVNLVLLPGRPNLIQLAVISRNLPRTEGPRSFARSAGLATFARIRARS